jgi:hypothetical protein
MKKVLVIAAASFFMTGVAFAHDGDKKCATKGKDCCKKEQVAKGKSCCKKDDKKETKATVKSSVVKKG